VRNNWKTLLQNLAKRGGIRNRKYPIQRIDVPFTPLEQQENRLHVMMTAIHNINRLAVAGSACPLSDKQTPRGSAL